MLCTAIAIFALANAQFHHPTQFRQAGGGNGFVPSIQHESGTSRTDDATPSATVNYRQQSFEYEEDEEDASQSTPQPIRRQQYLRPNAYAPQPQQPQQPTKSNTKNRFEDELEVEEPDRLALFLEKSTFQCEGRTG